MSYKKFAVNDQIVLRGLAGHRVAAHLDGCRGVVRQTRSEHKARGMIRVLVLSDVAGKAQSLILKKKYVRAYIPPEDSDSSECSVIIESGSKRRQSSRFGMPDIETTWAPVMGLQDTGTKIKGCKLFAAPCTYDEDRPGFGSPQDQEWFYRAMSVPEALAWLGQRDGISNKDGQPWASYCKYSMQPKYFNAKNPILIEVRAPGFLRQIAEMGFTGGKVEGNDMSWFTGEAQNSNSHTASGGTAAAIKQACQQWGLPPGKGNRLDGVPVIGRIFCQCITSLRVVRALDSPAVTGTAAAVAAYTGGGGAIPGTAENDGSAACSIM